ncbi:MAG TPA: methionyl-tRNA formyltransferase [Candidatus Saccharimonadales bacterium]|nr:methionyl-tRNA formyltransferase [Candidatus Saccharimonadales bacterium]
MSESKKLVFFGNEQLATGVDSDYSVLEALLDRGYDVIRIFSRPKDTDIENLATRHNIPLTISLDMGSVAKELKNLKPAAGILVAYGLVVPKEVIDIFPKGILNIHPSLLPKGRGPAPIEETILDGSKETGVSIMLLSEDMDKGPVLAQKKIGLSGHETKQYLADNLLQTGSELLINCLESIFSGEGLEPVPQADTGATYTRKIKKEDGVIDWDKPAKAIEKEIRAYAGWPKSRTQLASVDSIITAAEVSDESGKPGDYKVEGKSLSVFAGKGSLIIKRIQPAGKREMSTDEFLRGYAQRL